MVRKLLAAGSGLLIGNAEDVLDKGLRLDEVMAHAEVSHATFYRRFATKHAYVTELVEGLLDTPAVDTMAVRSAVREASAAADGDPRRAIRALVARHYADPHVAESVTRLLLATLFGDASPRTPWRIRARYAQWDQYLTEVLEELLGRGGIVFRMPFTAAKLAAALTAVIDGFALRARTDRDSVSARLLADTLLAVVSAAVDDSDLHGHVDDVLIGFDQRSKPSGRMTPDPRTAVIEAARTEFAERGYFAVPFATIAARADLSLDMVRKLFPTKAHIIVAGLKPRFDALAQAIEGEQLIELPEVEILRNHLHRCADLVRTEGALMDALVAVVSHDTAVEPAGMLSVKAALNFPRLLAPVIEQGQRRGIFTDHLPPVDIASTITNTLLLRCFTHRDADPKQNAETVGRILLDGLRRR